MAVAYYKAALVAIALVIIFGGVVDWAAWVERVETITTFLRANPLWFWVPAGLMILFLSLLALHLYVFGREVLWP